MQTNKRGQSLTATLRLVLCGVFTALAIVVMLVFRFNVGFLTFDLKDAVITVAGLLLGPWSAALISLVVAVVELITVGDTGFYGLIMNFSSSVTFSVVASLVYTYRKRLSGAIAGLVSAVVALVSVMLLLNLWVTPYYTGTTTADVAGMIPTLLLPFNVVKAMINAALVLILYKPVSRAMSAARLLPRGEVGETVSDGETTVPARSKSRVWVSVVVTMAGVVLFVGAILFVYFVLGGRPEWF